MGGRCARVAGELLGLVDFKGSGLVVKLPRTPVQELIDQGIGQPFAPAGKVFTSGSQCPSATAGGMKVRRPVRCRPCHEVS